MKLRQAWRRDNEIIDRERDDERVQLISVGVVRDAALAAATTAVVGMLVLLVVPLSAPQQVAGFGGLLIAVLAAAAVALSISERRRGADSPELVRALAPRQVLGIVAGAGAVAVLALVFGHSGWQAGAVALAFLLCGLGGIALQLRRAGRHTRR